jgi:hypothetical protein
MLVPPPKPKVVATIDGVVTATIDGVVTAALGSIASTYRSFLL